MNPIEEEYEQHQQNRVETLKSLKEKYGVEVIGEDGEFKSLAEIFDEISEKIED